MILLVESERANTNVSIMKLMI